MKHDLCHQPPLLMVVMTVTEGDHLFPPRTASTVDGWQQACHCDLITVF